MASLGKRMQSICWCSEHGRCRDRALWCLVGGVTLPLGFLLKSQAAARLQEEFGTTHNRKHEGKWPSQGGVQTVSGPVVLPLVELSIAEGCAAHYGKRSPSGILTRNCAHFCRLWPCCSPRESVYTEYTGGPSRATRQTALGKGEQMRRYQY